MKPGDLITVVTLMPGMSFHVTYASVVKVDSGIVRWRACGAFDLADEDRTLRARYLLDEGVTWIRGHHKADSPEVLAVKAAYTL